MPAGAKREEPARLQTTTSQAEANKPFSVWQRLWIAYSGEYVFNIMEPWEVLLAHAVLIAIFALLGYGLYTLGTQTHDILLRLHWYLHGGALGSPIEL